MNVCGWCGKRRKKFLLYQQRLICIPCHDGIIKMELQMYNQIMTRAHADVEIDHMRQFRKVMNKQYASPKQFQNACSLLYKQRAAGHLKYASGETVKLNASELRHAQQQPYRAIISFLQQKKEGLTQRLQADQ